MTRSGVDSTASIATGAAIAGTAPQAKTALSVTPAARFRQRRTCELRITLLKVVHMWRGLSLTLRDNSHPPRFLQSSFRYHPLNNQVNTRKHSANQCRRGKGSPRLRDGFLGFTWGFLRQLAGLLRRALGLFRTFSCCGACTFCSSGSQGIGHRTLATTTAHQHGHNERDEQEEGDEVDPWDRPYGGLRGG